MAEQLSNEQINALVAEKVMGWHAERSGYMPESCKWLFRGPGYEIAGIPLWLPSTDANHAREMEAEIERRGRQAPYIDALGRICAEDEEFSVARGIKSPRWFDFKLIHAMPRQRCLAALAALEQGEVAP